MLSSTAAAAIVAVVVAVLLRIDLADSAQKSGRLDFLRLPTCWQLSVVEPPPQTAWGRQPRELLPKEQRH